MPARYVPERESVSELGSRRVTRPWLLYFQWVQSLLGSALTGTVDTPGGPMTPVGPTNPTARFVVSTTVVVDDELTKTLPTAPVTLVEAPGPNRLIWPLRLLLARPGGQVAYGNVHSTSVLRAVLTAGLVALESGTVPGPDLLTPAGDRISALGWNDTPGVDTLSALVNKPLQLTMDNGAFGNLTGGGPGNRLIVTTEHTVVSLG